MGKQSQINGKEFEIRMCNYLFKKGYYVMSDKWFDEYNYQIVVRRKYLSPEILAAYDSDPIELKPWDPCGSLAF